MTLSYQLERIIANAPHVGSILAERVALICIGAAHTPNVRVYTHLRLLTRNYDPCYTLMIVGIGWVLMVDMTQYSKKDTPAQARERLQWQLDAIRANQEEVGLLLHNLVVLGSSLTVAKWAIADLSKLDRDAILQKGGILTDAQIELLS